ncbi:serine/threonine-protein phosphatase 6 regulatory ankyrin repeat subunit B-like [Dreissena polymorpha]|uniref:SOCS box domain-containing protein n=1 Tax=Dreissena polymorpha TaxID=45954 RepID=A0A9D3Y928_DREPO|nr:serine/threonine-protein phosphatase 6 regulatory ankyrin repeat subunit B-like [Dreissena polymorpha]XP_052255982.1 serine/threonine-protein phosphatase 6 regulatory ankyrin repeat subunit B-like [Dreissena polymorpha]XP_052255984.1 serine/threonine-protein phosphatase 6 regulatory ankyrin repeat subunit B-like [Dreissena polymorpha]XP_052255985.1 serine/threonine-protein phosphatase 6 regulatory ankyrin repeat subunit B-like [Dreissena polymorpha]XP_052255986.1 serine/threonine-protein pho
MDELEADETTEEGICDIYKEHQLLMKAIDEHNCALVHDLVHGRGLSPNFNADGHTPICRAAHHGYVDILDVLVEGGCDLFISEVDIWRRQALHIAASKGHIPFCQRLMDYGADVNSRDDDQRTPLHWSATYGNPAMTEFLITKGASVNISQSDGFTPLHAATCLGHNKVCQILLQHGAEINQTDRDGWSSFHTAVCYGHYNVVETLLNAGAPLHRVTNDEENAVHIAASSGKIEILKLLISLGAELNELTLSGNTAFYLSVYYGEYETTKYLIKLGADMHLPRESKKTPFYIAAVKNNIQVLKLLITAGYNLSIEDWILEKDFPPVLQKLPELCNLMYKKASNAKSLKETCRLVIRKCLKFDDSFKHKLDELLLPICLRSYLAYNDLDRIT